MNKQRKVVITTTYNEMGIIIDTKAEEAAQPNLQPTCNQLAADTISRQMAIDIERNATVDTNPSHFEAHQKFTQFMDDAEVSSFGRWQWSNGFNTALTAVGIDLKKLPSVQPEQRWIPVTERLPENDNEVLITVWDAEDDYVEVYKGFYQGHEWWTQWCHGCSKIKDEPCGENIVIAWMPLPEPYRGGEE